MDKKNKKSVAKLNPKCLLRELDDSKALAKKLAKHVEVMGASLIEISVELNGNRYTVKVYKEEIDWRVVDNHQ